MSGNLEAFLEHADLPTSYAETLREFGVERVDDLKSLSAEDMKEFGLPDEVRDRVSAAAKTYRPDNSRFSQVRFVAADDEDDDAGGGGGDIKAKLNALMAGSPPGGGMPGMGGRPPKAAPKKEKEATMEHLQLDRVSAKPARRPKSKKTRTAEELEKKASQDEFDPLDIKPLSTGTSRMSAYAAAETPRSQASKLSAWLAAAGLEEIEPTLVENGVALVEDLEALSRDDLEALGLEAAHVTALHEAINGAHPVQVKRDESGMWISSGGPPASRGRQVTLSERYASNFTGAANRSKTLSVSERTPSRLKKDKSKAKMDKKASDLSAVDGTPREGTPRSGAGTPRGSFLGRLKKFVGLDAESLSSLRSKAEQGNATAAVKALEMKPTDREVQRWGCRALANTADQNDAYRAQVCEAGGAAAAVKALKALPGQRAVEMQALRLLANISSGDDACKQSVLGAGGIVEAVRMVEETVAKASGATLVVQQGLRTVANLACGSPQVKQALLDAQAAPAVRKAMEKLAKDGETQRFGCAAFANLAGGESVELGRVAMRDAGGVACVVKAMRHFGQQPGVLAQAARALANLAMGDEACVRAVRVGAAAWEEAVIEMGGAPSVATAMASFPKQLEVVAWSLRTMTCVAALDPEAVRSCGGVRATVRAMTSHPTEEGVIAEALAMLATMAAADQSTKEGQRALTAVVDSGAAGTVVGALKRFGETLEVQEQGVIVLRFLVCGQEDALRSMTTKRAVSDAGAEAVLEAAAKAHPASTKIKECADAVCEQLKSVPKPLVVAPDATADEMDDPGSNSKRRGSKLKTTPKGKDKDKAAAPASSSENLTRQSSRMNADL